MTTLPNFKWHSALTATLVAGALLGALAGCQKQEGPAEHAGKKVDEASQKVGEQVEKAGENIQDAAKGNPDKDATK